MVPQLKALPTFYEGIRYRSRLEARWAMFFNTLGIAFEYEPEGFDLGEIWYLPDFRIPHLQAWVEIKPTVPSVAERERAKLLSIASQLDVFTFCSGFHSEFARYQPLAEAWIESSDGTPVWDDGWQWCECPKCGYLGIEFEGRSDRLGCGCQRRNKFSDRGHNSDSYRLLAAYRVAMEAKFA